MYDSRKSGSTTVSHLRFGPRPTRSSYLIQIAGFVAIHDPGLLERMDVFEHLADGGTVLLNTAWPPSAICQRVNRLPAKVVEGKFSMLGSTTASR